MLKERRRKANSTFGFHLSTKTDLKSKSRKPKLELVLKQSSLKHKTITNFQELDFGNNSNTETGIIRNMKIKNQEIIRLWDRPVVGKRPFPHVLLRPLFSLEIVGSGCSGARGSHEARRRIPGLRQSQEAPSLFPTPPYNTPHLLSTERSHARTLNYHKSAGRGKGVSC